MMLWLREREADGARASQICVSISDKTTRLDEAWKLLDTFIFESISRS